jgi:septal ring factor EnvC (AmiA/AmiB activator)
LPIADCSAAADRLPFAVCRLPIAYCLLPIAYCLLPIVYCRLSIADCLLSIDKKSVPMLKWMASCFVALMIAVALPAQQPVSSEELKLKQSEIQREIDELKNTLNDQRKRTSAGVMQLQMVKQKLRLREKAIRNINQQINMLESHIGKSKSEIDSLKDRLDTLKVQYAKNVVYAYKLRANYEYLNFIFSATSFNDALKRFQYFRAYHSYCEEQAAAIRNTQMVLAGKITGLEMTRKEKDAVIQKQVQQKQELEEEKKEKNAVVKTLKTKEKEIAKELTAKKKADAKLRAGIQKAIQMEFTKAANSPAAIAGNINKNETKKSALEATPEGLRISGSFENNKGRLSWPVDKAFVKLHFGRNTLPGELITNNPGLTIETEPGGAVKSIFEGEVSAVFSIEGNWTVMVKHGKYFTVYGNLASVSVAKNQPVTAGQVVGTAATNADGNGEIEFILMQERTNMDPAKWIRKR